MGKRHFKGANASEEKRRRKDNAEKWKSVRGDENNRNPWVLENARFEAFYKAQKFMKTDADWDSFMKHLQSPLPACFRIWSDYTFADELRNQMLEFAGKTLDLDGVEIKAAEQLKWYPGGYGYKLGTDRRSIRKLEGLSDLKKWMLQHTENGNITRQEAVSMVPPLALNVSPQHRCLDMCAAPGSKTSQLLEIVNRSLGDDESQQGLVVANDADTDRAYMLVHQCRRINSPLLVVSTHKGQHFPSIYSRNEGVENATKTPFFDRVLCDVPCSGDGTLRKNPAIWAKWSTSGGMTLHPLQLMIAQRGLQLLKEEGLLVYSTCSMSPYENEAVVAELLRNAGGGLELVDARQFLPLFNCRPGLTTWHVLDDFYAVKREARQRRDRAKAKTSDADAAAGETEVKAEENQEADEEGEENAEGSAEQRKPQDFSHIEDAELRACLEMGMTLYPDFASVPSHMDRKVRKSFFPPTEEEKQWMNLERCLRCVPQDEDTGGFFVATLRKIARPVAEEKVAATATTAPATTAEEECDEAACEAAAAADMGGDEEGAGKPQRSNGAGQQKANRGLVDFHQWDEETFQRIKEFYGFKDSLTCDAFFIREDNTAAASSGAKSIYFIPASVRALMHGDADARLKVVTAGVKVFEKKVLRSGDVDYRLLQDGISYLEPYITKRKISVTIQDFCNMLGGGLVSYTTLSAECISRLSAMPTGVVIATYEFNPEDVTSEAAQKKNAHVVAGAHKFQAICWKGGSRAINVMCGKIDIESIKHQLAALGVLRPKIGAARPVDASAVDVTEIVPKTAESEVKTEEVSVENVAMECEQPGA